MKRVLFTVLIIFLLILSLSCQEKSNLTFKYYRHININTLEPILGRYEVEHDEAMGINCYMFTYNNDSLTSVEYLKEGMPKLDPELEVAKINIEYKETFMELSFRNEEGDDIERSCGQFYQLKVIVDSIETAIINLNHDGKIMLDCLGVAKYSMFFNENDLPDIIFRHDIDDSRILDSYGLYMTRHVYDNNGNEVKVSNYDEDMSLQVAEKFGASSFAVEFDEYGNKVEYRGYDNEGKLAIPDDFDFPFITLKYDYKGNQIEYNYFNSSERLLETIKKDSNDNIVEVRYYDGEGNLRDDSESGAAIIKFAYNKANNEIERRFFDINNNLTSSNSNGAAVIKTDYFAAHDTAMSIQTYYDVNENLFENKNDGIATYQQKHLMDYTYSEHCNYDIDGNLKKPKGLYYAKHTFTTYEDSGYTEMCFYENNNELVTVTEGWDFAISRIFDDENDSTICIQTMNSRRELVEDPKTGAASTKYERDENGKMIKKIGYDKNNKIVYEEIVDE
ncbi:MAG: hypothetical protein GY839_03810 [candidate division Zixibacteria bacterium]|nr:hypothetical protein [candidate division Zixibacteria bacterium]